MSDDDVPDFNQIMSDARRWYYAEVRSIADEAIKECLARADKSDDPREVLTEWVEQTCDGHEFVIFTAQAWLACAASSNDDAYEDQHGEKPPSIEVRTYAALVADVWEQLEAHEDEWAASDDADDGSGGEGEDEDDDEDDDEEDDDEEDDEEEDDDDAPDPDALGVEPAPRPVLRLVD